LKAEPSPSITLPTNQAQKFEATNGKQALSLYSKEFLIACLIIAATTAAIFLPVMFRGLPSGHDASVHYRWAVQFKEARQETGAFYPRWLASANRHQGSPAMLYYPPLPFFVTAALSPFTKDMLQALALSCWLGMFLSGVTFYIFCRSHFPQPLSLFAALFYLIAPYHLLDFYHRTALSEFWAFVWIPLILDAVYRLTIETRWRVVLYLAFSYALLLFTHLAMAFALTLVLPIYFFLLTRKWMALVQMTAGLMLGFGLSAIFTIPVLFEREYVKFQRLLGMKYDNNFLFETLSQPPLLQLTEQGEINTLKLIDWIAVSLALVFLLVLFVLFFNRQTKKASPQSLKILRAILAIAVVTLLMTTRVASPIWKLIPQLAYMQFPFRWLTIASVCAAFLLCGASTLLTDRIKMRPVLIAEFLLIALTLAVSATVMVQASYDREAILKGLVLTEVKEYFPIWWDQPKRLEKQNLDETVPAIVVAKGVANATVNDDAGMSQSYEVQAINDATLDFRALYFPGWVAYVDGQKRAVQANEKGNIQFTIEPGEHQVVLRFEDTAPRTAGKMISSTCLLLGLFIVAFGKRSKLTKTTFLTPGDLENNNEAR
jgi:hypothetical protein